jgi:hypothetical protein
MGTRKALWTLMVAGTVATGALHSTSQAATLPSFDGGGLKDLPPLQATVPTAASESATVMEQIAQGCKGCLGIETAEARPAAEEEPAYFYKVGVEGFLRGEGSGSYSLADFSYTPGRGVGQLTYRLKPYFEWHPTDYLEIELEGQWYGYTFGPQHDNQFSVYQGYLELTEPEKKRLSLKLGRQEFLYGSAFILGENCFYNGLTFDAARLRFQPSPTVTVDLLGGYYAVPFTHYFDNYLLGAYATYVLQEGTAVEAYYFRDQGAPPSVKQNHRDSFGLRGTARIGPVALELEPVYQAGELVNPVTAARESISAWGGHLDLSVDAEIAGRKNTFQLGYAIGSGCLAAAAGTSSRKQFSNANNDTCLIGDMGFIGDLSGVDAGEVHGSGLQVATAGWSINLAKNLNFSAIGHYFRAGNTPGGVSREVGLETDFTLTWNIADDWALIAAYDRLFTAGFFRDATGSDKDIQYGYLMLQFDLFHGKRKMAKG